jgi:hypothetical protein
MNIMLDIETFDTAPSSVMLSLAAVAFNDTAITDEFMVNINLDESIRRGRTISASTMKFWLTHPEVLSSLFINPQGIEEGLSKFNFWVTNNNPIDEVWANGPAFDCIILGEYYRLFNRKMPWPFYIQRDFRTIKSMGLNVPSRPANLVAHNPLHDCIYQAQVVISLKQQQEGLRHGSGIKG